MKTPRTALTMLAPCVLWLTLGLSLSFSDSRTQAQTAPSARNPAPPAASPASATANSSDNAPADLTSDARLDRRISLHEIGIPLRSFLIKVGQGDLALSPDHNCDALELHLNLRNRPLRQLMTSLAQLVPGQWYHAPDGKGYVLRMNWKSVSRRQRWWDLYLEERQRVLRAVPEIALKAMGARPEIKGEVTSADGNHEGLKQLLLAGPTFFNQLPALLQKQIANNLNETSLFAGVRGTGMDEGAILMPLTDLPSGAQEKLRRGMRQPDRTEQGDCYAVFKNDGSGISASLVDADGECLSAGFNMDVPLSTEEPTLPLDHGGLVQQIKRMKQSGQDVPPLWKEFAAYQESRVWPNVLPSKGYNLYQDRVSELEKMADEDHLEFVSDYYSLPISYHSTPASPSGQQVKEERNKLENRLNALAAGNDLSLKPTQENIYLLRNNRWYRDDLLEVPMPLLQRWLEQDVRAWVKETEPAQMEGEALRRMLDWQAEVVSVLTPWQIFHGLRWATVPAAKRKEYASGFERETSDPVEEKRRYAPFRQLVSFGFSARYHLMQFYAGLSKEQRTLLLAGNLEFNALTADQQQQARYLQPLLIGLARQAQPIVLRLRHRPGGYVGGDVNVRLEAFLNPMK